MLCNSSAETSPIDVVAGKTTVPVNVGEAVGAFEDRVLSKPSILDVDIAAAPFISAFTIVPSAILPEVIAESAIIAVETVESGRTTAPVNVGEASGAFKLSADCRLSEPSKVVAGRTTAPVNVGAASAALRSSAVCVAVDTGFAESAVLSTFPRPTIDFPIPTTVPVNVGESRGALAFICV